MDTPNVGDYVFLRRRHLNSEFIPGLPPDCVERVGKVVSVEDGVVEILYPHGLADHPPAVTVTPKQQREVCKVEVVELMYPEKFERGGFGTVQVPVNPLYTLNLDCYKRRRDLLGPLVDKMVPDIKKNGLRHPIVTDHKLAVVFGSKRLAACAEIARERFDTRNTATVECYIVNGEHKELLRGAK